MNQFKLTENETVLPELYEKFKIKEQNDLM